MGLSLTILGCSGSYAGPDNACSGYLVASDATIVWLDTGPGTLANAQRHIDLGDLDAVVLSHNHPDHYGDFPVLRNALRYYLDIEGVPAYGPAEALALTEVVIPDGIEPTFLWETVADGDRIEVGDLVLRFSRTDHPVETLAVRVDGDGHSLVYSADTGPGWSLEALGDGLDAVLCEVTLPASYENLAPHLSGRQAGQMAAAAGVDRLLVTHVPPTCDPAEHGRETAEAFGGPVEVVEVNRRYEL